MQGRDQQAYHSSSVFRNAMLGTCVVFLSSLERSPCCPQPITFSLRGSTCEFGRGPALDKLLSVELNRSVIVSVTSEFSFS